MRLHTKPVLALLGAIAIGFGVLPAAHENVVVILTAMGLVAGCTLYLSARYSSFLSTWPGFTVVAFSLLVVMAVLRQPWIPAEALSPLPAILKLEAGLVAWALFVALFASSILLLIRRDASVLLMGIAWILVPLVLLAVGTQYGTLARFSSAPLGEQLFWGVPVLWAESMLCLGLPLFFAHLSLLIVREFNAR